MKNWRYWIVILAIPLAMSSLALDCQVTTSGDFDLLNTLLTDESNAYVVATADGPYGQTDYENLSWSAAGTDFVKWQTALAAVVDEVQLVTEQWNATTADDRASEQSDYTAAQTRLQAVLARTFTLNIVSEPWTQYLLAITLAKVQQDEANLAQATNALYSTSIPTPTGWNITFTPDSHPDMNSAIGNRSWLVSPAEPTCTGYDTTAQCTLANSQVIALQGQNQLQYLISANQTFGANLDWTFKLDRDVYFARNPSDGNTGPLLYNEPVALYVQGTGYIYRNSTRVGVDLAASSDPVYEWQIQPQWGAMSGLPVDTQQMFGLYDTKQDAYLTDCHQDFGVSLGWWADPTVEIDADSDCN